jgi:hypothetical protein
VSSLKSKKILVMLSNENVFNQVNNGLEGGVKKLKAKSSQNVDRSIEQMYQKKTQLEHILLRPDTYGK